MSCPRLVIGATQSGTGKTSVTLGLARALARRGLKVQPYKVGPDFLDPSYLALAAGRPCYNLDGWMMGENYVRWLFADTSAAADVALIEGVMGLFDGADPASNEGSTAEIAGWLGAPVLLVVNAHGMARSLAAVVKGFCEFGGTQDSALRTQDCCSVAGVIANQCGSERHVQWLKESLDSASLPPLVGAVLREALPALPSRHLGLVTATPQNLTLETLDKLADVIEKHLDLELLLRLARGAPKTNAGQPPSWARADERKSLTLAVARDAAFHFYYPDNLRALSACGCELAEFSPLKDETLPPRAGALYLGGGYPEEHACALADNAPLRQAIREFADSGGAIYAECGGLMYLAENLRTTKDENFPMAGVLPAATRMLPRRKALGYVEATLNAGSFFGAAGVTVRGHEFHYSELASAPPADWQRVYALKYRRKTETAAEGFQRGRVLASYVHAHFASQPDAARSFVDFCRSPR